MADFVDVNTEELLGYIEKMKFLRMKMDDSSERINRYFKRIVEWEDANREQVGIVLDEIRKKMDEIFAYINKLENDVQGFVDDIHIYVSHSKDIY